MNEIAKLKIPHQEAPRELFNAIDRYVQHYARTEPGCTEDWILKISRPKNSILAKFVYIDRLLEQSQHQQDPKRSRLFLNLGCLIPCFERIRLGSLWVENFEALGPVLSQSDLDKLPDLSLTASCCDSFLEFYDNQLPRLSRNVQSIYGLTSHMWVKFHEIHARLEKALPTNHMTPETPCLITFPGR